MTTNARLARTDTNGTVWYPALPFGWTTNAAMAAPHVLAPVVERIPFESTDVERIAGPRRTGSHASCSHESTKAARAICRRTR